MDRRLQVALMFQFRTWVGAMKFYFIFMLCKCYIDFLQSDMMMRYAQGSLVPQILNSYSEQGIRGSSQRV